ncbi:MAG TPA: hypothetical protein VEX13_08735 [Chloroflexia bacterium]|nr:hypothetical protein [Chloroflexia bacterium]
MPGSNTSPLSEARPASPRVVWYHLAWKLLLALSILLLLSLGIPLSGNLIVLVPVMLLAWGALFVGIASFNLFEGLPAIRWAWLALTVGAYGALAIPGVVVGIPRLADALGPVVALTLAAHLGRRDLPKALRDWALVMGLALYTALGVQAMLLLTTFGVGVFVVGALFPPILLEATLLLARRLTNQHESLPITLAALLLSTLLAVSAIAWTLLNRSTQPLWLAIFALAVGLLIGGALLVSHLTRPLIEAASGAYEDKDKGYNPRRALVELSHGPILISLVLYIPLRLLGMAMPGA